MILRFGVAVVQRVVVVVIIVEVGAEHRLRRHRPHRRHGVVGKLDKIGVARGLGARIARRLVLLIWFTQFSHQSEYLATGGDGAGPSTVNHLRYNVFHVPSRRSRSSVPLTNRTRPVFSRLTPIPYGSALSDDPTICR